jgi:rhodanese-related sulfurtransferase
MKVHLFDLLAFLGLVLGITLLPLLLRRWRQPGKMSPQQLHTLLSHGEPPLVIDVRNPDEFIGPRGHISEAVLSPLPELDLKVDEFQEHRARTIVLV